MNEKYPMTAEGLKMLRQELEDLKNTERPNVIKAIADAMGTWRSLRKC